MYDVMQGVRVIEVAEHTFVPAAGMVLADWGADVIKIERTLGGGDTSRHMAIIAQPGQKRNGFFEVANRGKRSVALDLTQAEGRAHLLRLVETADVFLTSLRTDARRKLGIEAEDLLVVNPRLIYARGTGYGLEGPMANRGGFDYPSSWCRSGSGFTQTPEDGPPPQQPGSVGDLTGGATIAGAVAAALFRRERTGKGAIVDHALYAMGIYIMTQSLASASLAGQTLDTPTQPRRRMNHPLVRVYRTSDDRWLNLCLLMDRWFPDLARKINRSDLLDDPRFVDEKSKIENADALIGELDKTFAQKSLGEWCEILGDLEGVWDPLLSPVEVINDEQALVNDFVVPITDGDGQYYAAASPGRFDQQAVGDLKASPLHGEHTDEVMHEIGLSDTEIASLQKNKVILSSDKNTES